MGTFRSYIVLIVAAEAVLLAVLPFFAAGTRVLPLALTVVPLTLLAALLVRRLTTSTAYRTRDLSPERITSYRPRRAEKRSTEELAHSIVERAKEIERALSESPSEVRVEMCALGYRACANDMITLTHRINEELGDAGLLKKLRLKRMRRKAIDALSAAREAMPPGALRATRHEHQ